MVQCKDFDITNMLKYDFSAVWALSWRRLWLQLSR